MKLIIDVDKKVVEVPHDFKELYDNQVKLNKRFGKDSDVLSSMLDLSEYKVIAKQTRAIKDTTNAKTIATYMESVKDTDKSKYDEYVKLRDSYIVNKNNVRTKVSFLTIKRWFYENYPEQNPYKKGNK